MELLLLSGVSGWFSVIGGLLGGVMGGGGVIVGVASNPFTEARSRPTARPATTGGCWGVEFT